MPAEKALDFAVSYKFVVVSYFAYLFTVLEGEPLNDLGATTCSVCGRLEYRSVFDPPEWVNNRRNTNLR